MSEQQQPGERPVPSLQRKAAIATGAAVDHRGEVLVAPIPDFDLGRTIFKTLEGTLPRFVMRTRIAKEAHWSERAAHEIETAYKAVEAKEKLPAISPELLRFMIDDCDFNVEHADGSFLDHLYFCFEYTAVHYAGRSPLVMLLHSILGTGTNTFAMKAEKIPQLRALLNEHDWAHIESFPSVLRLLYDLPLRQQLRENLSRLSSLKSISFRRVIDNAPITMSAEDFFVQLNYQLIHLVDFLPVANWSRNANDTAFIVFRDLYELLDKAGKRVAEVKYAPTAERSTEEGRQGLGARLVAMIPIGVSEKMAARAVRNFSARIGHDMTFSLNW